MISAAVVAAAVGFVPVTAQAAGPSAGTGRAATAASPAAAAASAQDTSAQDASAQKAAKEAAAEDVAAKLAAAKAPAGAPRAAARAQRSEYFEVGMGTSTSYAHTVGLATSVATDLANSHVRYDVDWGDGTKDDESGPAAELVYVKHRYAEVGSHKITITATDIVTKLTSTTTKDVVVDGSEFTPHAPTRLLDTRDGTGTGTSAGRPVAPYATTRVKVAGNAGIPAGVTAVALNLTATNTSAGGHVIAYASGKQQPTTSNVNFAAGQTVPNLAVVPVGEDGYVELANRSEGSVDLIADVTGYFTRSAAGGYTSVKPSRLVDTRQGLGTAAAGQVAGQATFGVQIAGQGGLPAKGVTAVALNVTVTGPKDAGHLTVFPSDQQAPSTSSVNFAAGQTVANSVIVPVGPDGRINVRNGAWSPADVIVDVTGYYSADGKAAYLPMEPQRMYDSRTSRLPLDGQSYHHESVWTSGRALEALVLNTTVTNPRGSGHLSVAPDPNTLQDYIDGKAVRPTPPDSSVLNWTKDATVANLVQVSTGSTGVVDFWNRGWEQTDLIVDLYGMYDRN
ncbi:PKD domain-containing protein [Streptomyces sp. NPDC001903]|uniref:PKD domain-containing protein n=1 Tax=Streptomyces sp. NPDC001903 TaxID=3364622 RepID=UPI00367965BA